ncbi:EF-hand domain-containing protein [Streptomyces kunmingensis]|uniref:EF-hand domain-containing protein n=1 Tax=Streptomyces kunmingensis TaxID=68225 RepID=A0ABU6C822_9ACTN|nr:EF-hand domain-containing protein [Streptomyces kunmingensis]MEB3960862.1 EF-hand domain-containing protein [Streptomyces kunmingensis]
MDELRKRKYERWFRAADVDGDDAITRQDVVMMSERYLQARGILPDSSQARQMHETMTRFWESVIAPGDADKDGRVTSAEVTQVFAATFTDRGRYPEELAPVADNFFDLADSNGDDAISRTEFTHIFGSTGRAADAECAEVFNALDLDASGALSRAEYHKAASEFFYGDDPESPANHLFGRLA